MMLTRSELEILGAEKDMVIKEARPAVTFSGGFKRLKIDQSKSLLFGVSLPIPIFNRNQGERQSLTAQMHTHILEIIALQEFSPLQIVLIK